MIMIRSAGLPIIMGCSLPPRPSVRARSSRLSRRATTVMRSVEQRRLIAQGARPRSVCLALVAETVGRSCGRPVAATPPVWIVRLLGARLPGPSHSRVRLPDAAGVACLVGSRHACTQRRWLPALSPGRRIAERRLDAAARCRDHFCGSDRHGRKKPLMRSRGCSLRGGATRRTYCATMHFLPTVNAAPSSGREVTSSGCASPVGTAAPSFGASSVAAGTYAITPGSILSSGVASTRPGSTDLAWPLGHDERRYRMSRSARVPRGCAPRECCYAAMGRPRGRRARSS